jgi:dTDP-4-amino-4,6-dideoxygalactose transaminase
MAMEHPGYRCLMTEGQAIGLFGQLHQLKIMDPFRGSY